jgi:hypothetical protein
MGPYPDNWNNPRLPYVKGSGNQLEREIVSTIEDIAFLYLIRYVMRRIVRRHHLAAGIIFLLSGVSALAVLINSDYGDNSVMVWLFWSLCAVAFVSLAKAIS